MKNCLFSFLWTYSLMVSFGIAYFLHSKQQWISIYMPPINLETCTFSPFFLCWKAQDDSLGAVPYLLANLAGFCTSHSITSFWDQGQRDWKCPCSNIYTLELALYLLFGLLLATVLAELAAIIQNAQVVMVTESPSLTLTRINQYFCVSLYVYIC